MNEVYKFLKDNNLTQLDEKSFLSAYSTPEAASEIHKFFVDNKLTDLDNESFFNSYLKKKETTQSASRPSGSTSVSPLKSSADQNIGGTFQQVAQQAKATKKKVTPLRVPDVTEIQQSAASLEQIAVNLQQQSELLNQLRVEAAADKAKNDEYNKLVEQYNKEADSFNKQRDNFNVGVSAFEQAGQQDIAGGFADVLQQVKPFEQAVVKEKLPKTFSENIVAGLQGKDKASRAMMESEAVTSVFNAMQRGKLMGEQADLLNAFQDVEGVDVNRLAEIQAEMQRFRSSEEYEKAMNAGSLAEMFDAAKSNPVGVLAELITESGAALLRHGWSRAAAGAAMGAVGGSVVPVVGTAAGASGGFISGLGMASLNLEYSGKILEILQEEKVDVTNGEAIKKAFVDEAKVAQMRKKALQKGVPIALFDMISGGVAGKFAAKAVGKSAVKKAVAGAAETGTQAVLGGLGEAAGQVVAGEQINPVSIFAEMIAEPATSVGEVVVGTLVRNTKANKPIPVQEVAQMVNDKNFDRQAVNDMIDASVGLGEITEEQRDLILDDIDAVIAASDAIPETYADKRAEIAPMIIEKRLIDNQIAQLEIRKAQTDEAFIGEIDQQISQLNQQKQDINARIQQAVTPSQATPNQASGTEVGGTEAGVGTAGEGVSGVGVQAASPIESLVGKRVSFTDANGNLVEGDAYIDGQRFVVESKGRIYDIFGSVEELSALPQNELAVQEVQPRVLVQDGKYVYNSDAGAMPIGTEIVPQGSGLKSVKRDKNGVVKSVVVTAADGKTYNLKGEDANAMAYELMMDEISKGNLDAKVILNEEFANRVNTAVAGQASRTANQATQSTQGQADGDTSGVSKGRDGGGKVNEKAGTKEGLLEGVRSDRPQGKERKESTQLRTEKEKVGGKDVANEKPSAEKVSVGKQPESSKGVRGQDTQGQEAAEKSKEKAKSKLEQAREKRKAAIEKLKQNIDKAKNAGIASLDFNQRMKDDKEFFGAIKDIIESNVEIGVTKISEIYAEIADLVGKSLSVTDKAEVKKLFNNVVLKELRSEQLERFEAESVRDAMKEYLSENRKVLNAAANTQALKMVNAAQTESSFIAAIKYLDKIINDQETRNAYNAASEALDKAKKRADTLAGTQEVKESLKKINAFGIKASELLKEIAEVLDPRRPMPKAETIKALADKVVKYVTENMNGKQVTLPDVRKRIDDLFKQKQRDENNKVVKDDDGNVVMVEGTFDTAAKVRGLMRKINNIKSDIAKLDISLEEQEELTELVDNAVSKIDAIAQKVGEAVEVQRVENLNKAKQIISSLTADDFADPDIFEAYIKPILDKKGAIELLGELTYTQSEMLLDALADVENGYLPVGFYRNFTEPVLGNDRVKAALELAESPTVGELSSFLKFFTKGKNQARKLIYKLQGVGNFSMPEKISKWDLKKMLDIAFADKVDNLFGRGRTQPFNNNFVIPLKKSIDNVARVVTDMQHLFSKETGINLFDLILFGKGIQQEIMMNRVGAFLIQRRVNNERGNKGWNVLKYNAEFAVKDADKAVQSAINQRQKDIWNMLNKQYPDGIKEENLTEKEKKIVKAFDNIVAMLTKMQKISNLRSGKVFNQIEGYAPLLAMENAMEASRTLAESNDFSTAMSLLAGVDKDSIEGRPKYRSDRGLNSDPNAGPYVAHTNAGTMINNAIVQVVTEYYMFPVMYSANRAFTMSNQITKNDVGNYLRDRFADIIRTERARLKTTFAKTIGKISTGVQSTILLNFQRYFPEFVGGLLLFGRYPSVRNSPVQVSQAFKETATSYMDGSFKKAADLAMEDGFNKFEEIEVGKLEEYKRMAGKLARTLTSPDSLQETAFSRTAFVLFMKQKYKEITGKSFSMSDLNNDDFVKANKDALKEAANFAYGEVKVKADTRFGRPPRPIWFLPFVSNTGQSDLSMLTSMASYFLSGFAQKQGAAFRWDLYDSMFGVNKDRKEAALTAVFTVASTSAYQIAKQGQLAALGAASIYFASMLAGDDEEKKEEIIRKAKASVVNFYNNMASTRFLTAQFASGIMYLYTANLGSIGKLMTYIIGDEFVDMMEQRYKDTGKSQIEFIKDIKEPIENLVKDATYKELGISRKDGLLNKYSIVAGGGAVVAEEVAKLIEALKLGVGDGSASDLAYALGTTWNIAFSKKLPLPFTRYIAKDLKERNESLEAAIRKYKADSRKEDELIEQLVLKHGSSSLEGKVSPEKAFENLFEEAFNLIPITPDNADLAERIIDKYDDMTLPVFIKGIKKKQSSKEKGLEAAKWQIKIEDMGDTKEAVEMQTELWRFIGTIDKNDADFWDFYFRKMEEENKK